MSNVFKRLVAAASALVLAFLLAGCDIETPIRQEDKLRIVATAFPQYDFARSVAGGLADITMLIPPASDSHSYDLTPNDMMKITECDIFIYAGGESDAWITDMLKGIQNDNIRIISFMDEVELFEEESIEGMEHDDEHGHGEYDEHVWTSPKNAILLTKAISEVMQLADPENAAQYAENTDAYIAELTALDAAFEKTVSDGVRNTVIFGDRFPFLYFAKEYGLNYFAAFPGCAEASEPSTAVIRFLTDKVREENIPVVFCLELSNKNIARAICDETGAKLLMFHSCHNVTSEEFEGGATYLSLMWQNVDKLEEALN